MQLVTATWCSPCTMTKMWLSKHYPQLELEVLDLDKDDDKINVDLRGVPALIDVDQVSVGFDSIKDYLEQLYAKD